MLTEHFIAAISTPNRKPDTSSVTKDVGIFLHEHRPLLAQRNVFKKSAASPNCVAASRSHVFAAQIDKAVVHVYSREKGSQEAVVPFPERITSLALALDDTVLVLGTEGGRIILWEISTGRTLTGPQSHLQPVNLLAVDSHSHSLLSGSADSNIHVWSLPSLLSFTAPSNPSPLHTLSNHRGAVTALAVGHSSSAANIVVSASKDNTAIVWDYRSNMLLATYLLGDTPLALALDPADRGFFATYEDGSVQYIDFFVTAEGERAGFGATDSLRDPDTSYTPITPTPSTRWRPDNQDLGAGLTISLSWDGDTVLVGHASGKITSWSPSSSTHWNSVLTTLPGPVTNIAFLTPTGFPIAADANAHEPKYRIHAVVKPRLDLKAHMADGEVTSPVPQGYTFNSQLVGDASKGRCGRRGKKSAFEEALTHTSFPPDMLEQSLAELAAFTSSPAPISTSQQPSTTDVEAGTDEDFMALDPAPAVEYGEGNTSLEQQNAELREQVALLQRRQKATLKQWLELREENKKLKGTKDGEKEGDTREKEKKRKERLDRVMKEKGRD